MTRRERGERIQKKEQEGSQQGMASNISHVRYRTPLNPEMRASLGLALRGKSNPALHCLLELLLLPLLVGAGWMAWWGCQW